jgi:NCS1 family nucleobase:cation symporter-1
MGAVSAGQSGSGGEGSWPVVSGERTWGSLALFGVAVSTAIATWCFLIGGYVAYYLPAVSGTLVMIAGSLVGILLVVISVVPVANKYGIDSVASSKPVFGWRGSYFGLFLVYGSIIGWNCFLMIFLGKASAEILIVLGIAGEGSRDAIAVVSGLLAIALVWALVRGGPDAMRNVGPIIAVTVLVLAVVIAVLLFAEVGWDKLSDAQPLAPSTSKLWNFTTGFELMVSTAVAWWAYAGGMVRLVGSRRKATWPLMLGLSVPVALVSTIGLWSALAIPDSAGDPTIFLVDLGGVPVGIVALAFIVLANVGTTMVGVYCTAIGLRQMPALERRSWNVTTTAAIVPVGIVLIVAPTWVYDHIGTFLAFMGAFFAPVCAVQAVDNLLLRRGRLDLRALYAVGRGTAYHYWHGVNVVAFASVGLGWITYILLLDPVSFESRSPYQYLSASLPAAGVAALLHVVLTRVIVTPSGRGGYRDSVGAEAGRQEVAEPAAPVAVASAQG